MFHNAIGTSNKSRKLMIYDGTKCYDGERYFNMAIGDIYKARIFKSNTSKYLPVKIEQGLTLEQSYNNFKAMADKILLDTDGKIDLYKSGSLSKASLKLFFEMIGPVETETITEQEAEWINNCNQGAIIYQNDYMGPVYNYDINSMYQSILKNPYLKIPIKRGSFEKIDRVEFEKLAFYKYGLYHVNIKYDNKFRKLFRFNKENYYTSFDLTQAKKYGLEINYIECKHNFLYYGPGTFMNGSILFKEFVDLLYGWRKKTGDKIYKIIANSLWGALVESNIQELSYDINDENFNFDFHDNTTILQQRLKGTQFIVTYVKNDKYFKYQFARMKPFILAIGRQMLDRIIEPHIDSIHRIHTDGFCSSKELNIALGDRIGELRFDGFQKNVAIIHVNKIIDLDNVQPKDLDILQDFFERTEY